MTDGMDEIIEEFVAEAEESLEKIDPLFIELETKKTADKDILNDIFRSMHTIKGAAGFLGMKTIVDVAHRSEALLKKLRDEEMAVSTSVISIILKSVDMLKAILHHIRSKDGVKEDIAPLLGELDDALLHGEALPADRTGEEEVSKSPSADRTGEEEVSKSPSADLTGEEEVSKSPSADRTGEEEGSKSPSAEVVPGTRETGPAVPETGLEPARPSEQHEEKAAATQAPATTAQGEFIHTLRVDVNRIDKVMNLTGEIVLVRNRLINISNSLEGKYSGDAHVDGLHEAVSFLDLVTSDIQLAVMKMRMQPIKKVFSKFPRLVRDLSQNMGKDVELNISGENTEVDRTVIEKIGDPLVHIIRNSIDHGLESRGERIRSGKPEKGVVDISAFQRGNQIVVELIDDGRGIDIEKIRNMAVRRGLATQEDARKMDDKEAMNLIFLPGFSTLEEATELSGRGVGMDVVKTNISKLNGYIEIFTTAGVGTTFRISIPLTLAIIQALMVRTAGVQYAIPLAPIEETFRVEKDDIDHVTGRSVLAIRGKVHPIAELETLLGYSPREAPDNRYVLVMAIGNKRFCVGVDELLGQEEVVIKSIEGIDTETTGILGATITGDGKIVLILDPSSMADSVAQVTTV
jgi:two-component system chemotaxis sensor kinase CheA